MATFDSWRVKVNYDVRSSKVFDTTGAVGGTVIRAPRGTEEPTYFSPGQTKRILDLLGTPTPDYPDILEVIQYNNSYPIWVSAPSVNGLHGGVHLTANGIKQFTGGISAAPNNFTAFTAKETLGTGDGSTSSFGITLTDIDYYTALSVKILVDGTELTNGSITSGGVNTEDISYDEGTGSLDTSTGALSFNFSTPPAQGAKVSVEYTVDYSGLVYFSLYSRAPEADTLGLTASFDASTAEFTLNVYQQDNRGNYVEIAGSPFTVSADQDAVNGYGNSIYVENVFEDNDFIRAKVNTDLTPSSFTDEDTIIAFAGGDRGDTVSGADLAGAYTHFQSTRKYQVDVFFDVTADGDIPAMYSTLRNSYAKYARYILPLPNESASDAQTTFGTYSLNNRGISIYWNWGEVTNPYSSRGNLLSPLTGRVAVKHADIIVRAYGGLAPAWIDENGMGGQLTGGIVRMVYDPDQNTLQELDLARINPIVDEPGFGPMIVSRRTTQSNLDDFAFIDYSGAMDYIVKNVLNNVAPYQIVKLNDATHRDIVRAKTNAIVTPMLNPPYPVVFDALVKCDEENNNEDVQNREEFVLTLGIQFTRKSRMFIFNIVNTNVGVNLEEAV
jgi:hypothetical protein